MAKGGNVMIDPAKHEEHAQAFVAALEEAIVAALRDGNPRALFETRNDLRFQLKELLREARQLGRAEERAWIRGRVDLFIAHGCEGRLP